MPFSSSPEKQRSTALSRGTHAISISASSCTPTCRSDTGISVRSRAKKIRTVSSDIQGEVSVSTSVNHSAARRWPSSNSSRSAARAADSTGESRRPAGISHRRRCTGWRYCRTSRTRPLSSSATMPTAPGSSTTSRCEETPPGIATWSERIEVTRPTKTIREAITSYSFGVISEAPVWSGRPHAPLLTREPRGRLTNESGQRPKGESGLIGERLHQPTVADVSIWSNVGIRGTPNNVSIKTVLLRHHAREFLDLHNGAARVEHDIPTRQRRPHSKRQDFVDAAVRPEHGSHGPHLDRATCAGHLDHAAQRIQPWLGHPGPGHAED